MSRIIRAMLLAVLLLPLTFAASSQPRQLDIVASFSILADVVQRVAGDTATVTSLIPVGADPHSFEPSARDIAALADAELIFVAGANFEESLLHAIETAAPDAVVAEASACVPMRLFGGEGDALPGLRDAAHRESGALGLNLDALCMEYESLLDQWEAQYGGSPARVHDPSARPFLYAAECGEHDHEDDHDDEAHEHDDDHDHDDEAHDHDHGACDPHVWSDPRNVMTWTRYIRDVLSKANPENAEIYAANADAYLKALDDKARLELEPLLAAIPAENRVLLTNHETLNYFAAAYGFTVAGFVLPGGSALAEPSARDLAALIEAARAAGVTAIFAENTSSSRVAQQVAAESGVAFYTLYTDSLGEAGGEAGTYLDYLAYNLTTIAAALTPQ